MTLRLASAAFLEGYALGRRQEDPADSAALLEELAGLDLAKRPFAFEGAAMAWEMSDADDRGDRAQRLLDGSGPEWRTFVLLGVGCARARLDEGTPTDPLVLDGYGFQTVLRDGVVGLDMPTLGPHAERGRGRALWFVTGGDAPACAGAIGRVGGATDELWRGVATACAFAGDPRAQAGDLTGLAGEQSGAVRAGVEQGVGLWRSLGEVPARTAAVADAVLLDRID